MSNTTATVTTARPVTRPQVDLIANLVRERNITGELATHVATAREQVMARTLTYAAASTLITALRSAPYAARDAGPLGMHVLDGNIYRVVKARYSDHRYAQIVNFDPETGKVTFDAPATRGMVFRLSEATRMTTEAAAEFGHHYHRCCNCGKDLTDPRSTTAGYGPVCAANNGWEWGTVAA